MFFLKPVSISLSPNTEKDDILLAFKLLFQCRFWKDIEPLSRLEGEFKKYLGVKYAISFDSGRSALISILEALNIKENDEILLQAFTCNSVIIPILKQKAKPIYVDTDQTLNLDPEDLKKKITSKSRAILIQHTFGWPAQVEEISKIAKQKNLYLIEDCAHSLGARFKDRLCGTFGDASFFSFGRDKIISSVFGGMVVSNNEEIGRKIKNFQEKLSFPSTFWIFQQLLHPILINCLILPAYGLNANFGRVLLAAFQQVSFLSKAVSKKEKKGEIFRYSPKRLSGALAFLALNQFQKLERFNDHRKEIVGFYEKSLKNPKFILPFNKSKENISPTFLRYPILTSLNTDKILEKARKRKIYLDDGWRKSPVVPPDTNIEKMKYQIGNCPQAEKLAKNIVNLPTHININLDKAKKIIDFLNSL